MTKKLTSSIEAKKVISAKFSGGSSCTAVQEGSRDLEIETYRIGKYKCTVISNKPSQRAIESFIELYNNLFEKEVSRDNYDQDVLSE
ncbi:hypothetical protein PASE110613_05480 [Paenibacillus sediminis]|uniref:Uncharacterized protein n=1 Tax=Paenibacillus sediminis TaxID=664909 RepID=A0ABS4H118_9BACL|nr:hypothetical protein [Paenibacillus sediminis]MBP1936227.1 hypothetical protein [Paenibacillus sediminis]